MDFTCSERVADAHWQIRYIVDMTATRHVLEVRAPPSERGRSRPNASCRALLLHASRHVHLARASPVPLTTSPLPSQQVGNSDTRTYEAGASTLSFHADGIELEGVKKSMLNNVGLLLAVLVDARGEEVVQVSMVTQVMKQPDGLQRLIISPLE